MTRTFVCYVREHNHVYFTFLDNSYLTFCTLIYTHRNWPFSNYPPPEYSCISQLLCAPQFVNLSPDLAHRFTFGECVIAGIVIYRRDGTSYLRPFQPTRIMRVSKFSLIMLAPFLFGTVASAKDFAKRCYKDPIPPITPSPDNRTIPWGKPSFKNGTQTCCTSLDEVRTALDLVDNQLLQMLSMRYVQQARRT